MGEKKSSERTLRISFNSQKQRAGKAEVDKTGGHARHLFHLASGKSGSAESWPKGKSFGEDMIHFYFITKIFWEILH